MMAAGAGTWASCALAGSVASGGSLPSPVSVSSPAGWACGNPSSILLLTGASLGSSPGGCGSHSAGPGPPGLHSMPSRPWPGPFQLFNFSSLYVSKQAHIPFGVYSDVTTKEQGPVASGADDILSN